MSAVGILFRWLVRRGTLLLLKTEQAHDTGIYITQTSVQLLQLAIERGQIVC
ncbi:MAG: hypothetical protein ACRD7E_18190 [Bryobacteraceae bacterium]